MLRNRKGMLKGLSPFKHDDGTKHSHAMKIQNIKGKIPNPIHSEPVSDMPAVTVTPSMEEERKKKKLKKTFTKGLILGSGLNK